MAGNRGDSLLGERLEATAYIDLFKNAPAEFAQSTSLAFRAIGRGCAISLPPAPTLVLNRIQGLHGLDELREAYGWLERRTGTHYLQISPDFACNEVLEWLDSKRLIKENPNWSKLMWRGDAVDEHPSEDFRIRAATGQDADLFGSITSQGFGLPPAIGRIWQGVVGTDTWICLIGYWRDQPVAAGAMFVNHGCAWLGVGTTLKEHRNKGLQKALIRARLGTGLRRGIKIFYTETVRFENNMVVPNVSLWNLEKVGFRQVHERSNFRIPPFSG